MNFKEYWANQFKMPHGLGGKISTFLMKILNKPMIKAVVNEVKNDGIVLDIGFADGYVLKKLATKNKSSFYGIDISEDMVKIASKKNKRFIKDGRMHLFTASAERINIDVSFDQIYTLNTVYFWEDLEETLSEIYSKLKVGGEFINVFRNKAWLNKISCTKYGFKKYTEEELIAATKNAGFLVELILIKQNTFYIKAIKV